MGRGRAKAKQTKVARQLKYSSPETDYEKLQRELAGGDPPVTTVVDTEDDDDFIDPYAVDDDDEVAGHG